MRIVRRTRGLVVIGLISTLPSCDATRTEPRQFVERDSSGITIVEAGSPIGVWSVAEEPLVRIGSLDADSTQILDDVAFAASLPDGGVIVADAGLKEIRSYGADGQHRAVFGSPGEGPGEFAVIASAILIDPDTVIVFDPRLRRLTWVPLDGSVPRDLQTVMQVSGEFRIIGVDSSGQVLLERMEPHPDPGMGGYQYSRDTLAVLRFGLGTSMQTLLRVPGSERLFLTATANGQPSYRVRMPLPFAANVSSTMAHSGIVIADGFQRQVERRNGSGSLRTVTRFADREPRFLTSEERARFVDFSVAQMPSGTDPSAAASSAQDKLEMVPSGHAIPPFDVMLADALGYVWLRDYHLPWEAAAPQNWTVLDQANRPIARVTTPAGVTVTHVRQDRITGFRRGELDEQYVVVHRLSR